jgi:glycosyltransferase involved in cell wall biosynthesis
MPTVLWWGRSDREYSRNRIVRQSFLDLGWTFRYFHPFISQLGLYEAYLRRLQRPDLVWVPCFRHKDIMSASHWADKWRAPLIIDPLISAFEKEVYEKNKHSPNSNAADNMRKREANLFSKADIIIADTPAHREFFQTELRVPSGKIEVLYVGAETGIFHPSPAPPFYSPYEILFYGSFLKLQGADVIARAAEKTQDLEVIWTFLGDGEYRRTCERLTHGFNNVRFESWLPYEQLPDRIAKANILLGIFGSSVKADLVIPNKVFQAMAVGRPVITRRSKAYQTTLVGSDVIGWVSPGDPATLAFVVRKWFEDPSKLAGRGEETRALFDRFFGDDKQQAMLNHILERAIKLNKNWRHGQV